MLADDEASGRKLHEDRAAYRRRPDEYLGPGGAARSLYRTVLAAPPCSYQSPGALLSNGGWGSHGALVRRWRDTVQHMNCVESMRQWSVKSVDCCAMLPPLISQQLPRGGDE
jgi:hypothetical protein